MKRKRFTRTLLLSMFASALLSFTACKSDEDKCKDGDLTACQRTLAKAENDMKLALDAIEKSKNVGDENRFAGTLVDKRDGKKYKTVKIGNQTWMAENLNYKTKNSYCYGGKSANCKKYGRLYTWNAAMKACPEGWRLPSKVEFETLFKFVRGVQEDALTWGNAGKMLKSTNGWNEYEGKNGNGNDAFGFSALPAGFGINGAHFFNEGYNASFWSSTEDGSIGARSMGLRSSDDDALILDGSKGNESSVRCVKN